MPQQPSFESPFELGAPRKRIEDLKIKSPIIGKRIDAVREVLVQKFLTEYSNPDDAADHVISELLGFSVEVQPGVYTSHDVKLESVIPEGPEIKSAIQRFVWEINDVLFDRREISRDRDKLLKEFRGNLQEEGKARMEAEKAERPYIVDVKLIQIQEEISEELRLKSEELSKHEIDNGHLAARLAVFYLNGIGFDKNLDFAETLFLEANEQGYPPEELIKQGSERCKMIAANKEFRLGKSSHKGDKKGLEKDVAHAILHFARVLSYGGANNKIIEVLTMEPEVDETSWRLEYSTPLTCDEILEVFEGMSKCEDTRTKLTGFSEKFAARLVETSKQDLSLEDVEKISKKLSEISGDEKGKSVSMKRIGKIMEEKKREKDVVQPASQIVDWDCKTPSTSCHVSYAARLMELGKNLVKAIGSTIESFVDRVLSRSNSSRGDGVER
jgi:hypothetical protein